MNTSPKPRMGGGGWWLPSIALLAILSSFLFGCESGPFTLTVSSTPNNGGTVSPGSGTYNRGEKVTLFATPAKYYTFNGWTGSDVSDTTSNRITITIDSNKTIGAIFVKETYSLQMNQNPANGGRIEPQSNNYEAGNQVRITAIPASGYRFDRWTGSQSEASNPIDVLIDNNKILTANFIKVWNLSESCSPDGSGSINPGTGTYDDGSKLTLTTVPNFPYAFDHWGENNDKNNTTSVTLNADKSVTAYFTKLSPGTQQVKTGVYNGFAIPIPVQLSEGQWIEVGLSSSPPSPLIPLRILDPSQSITKDFGGINSGSYAFQAKTSGTYTIDIKGTQALILYGPGFKVTYTIYSMPSPIPSTQPTPPATPTPTPTLTSVITIQDSLTVGDDGDSTTWDTSQIRGQRWTPSSAYRMTSIDVFMRRVGQPGNAVLIVRATDGSNPVGQNLASVTIAASNISQANSWVHFDIMGIDLEVGKTYWWGIYAESGSSSANYYALRYDSQNGYQQGAMWNSSNGVVQPLGQYDDLFKIYGQSYR